MSNSMPLNLENIKQLPTDILEDVRIKLSFQIAEIKNKIESAKIKAAVKGEYSNADWFRRVNAASRIKGMQLQAVDRELGQRRRAANINASKNSADYFKKAAFAMMTKEDFDRIEAKAKDMMSSEEGLKVSVLSEKTPTLQNTDMSMDDIDWESLEEYDD